MMTIKVIQHLIDGKYVIEKGAPKTFLFSGDEVQYKNCFFDSKEAFVKHYERETKRLKTHVIGIPLQLWNKKEIRSGTFVSISFLSDNEMECIICQNSSVFIMQGRQTVDSITMTEYDV